MENLPKKLKVKGILVTEDGEDFLLVKQHYLADFRTGVFIDGGGLTGRHFKLVPEEKETNAKPLMEDSEDEQQQQ